MYINELELKRKDLDTIDFEILNLLKKRTVIVNDIWKLKKSNNLSIIDNDRKYKAKQDRIEYWMTIWLFPEEIDKLYTVLHDIAVEREERA